MSGRIRSALLTTTLLFTTLLPLRAESFSQVPNTMAQPVQAFASAEFQKLWSQTDAQVASGEVTRSWLWGPQPGATLDEPYAGGAAGTHLVQYFDKARMELNSAVTDPASPWRITTGLLVSEMVEGRAAIGNNRYVELSPARIAVAGDDSTANPTYASLAPYTASASDRTGEIANLSLERAEPPEGNGVRLSAYIRETGHNLPDVFLNYLSSTGQIAASERKDKSGPMFDWVYVMGYPITEPLWTTLRIGGKDYPALIQLFQRRVLTYVPGFAPAWRVQMGNAGQHYYGWRYGGRQGKAAGVSLVPVPSPTLDFPSTGAYVGISGSNFTYAGAPAKLKGTNYWIHTQPFVGTWSDWDGPQALAELEKAKELGVNTIRVGIPYDHFDTLDIVWNGDKSLSRVGPGIIKEMAQLLQIAGLYGMKVIFVLFEWNNDYPAVGTKQERSNIAYLQGIVGAFANDDRVLGWDLHNEPDNYDGWQGHNKSTVIKWLQRIYGYVRDIDRRHPITVGVGDYRNLTVPAADGTTLLDISDFVSFHCYDAGALNAQISDLAARTKKPILLEEMGWPTAPGDRPPSGVEFTEARQNYLYETMLQTARTGDIAGVVQWTLFDFTPGSTNGGKETSFEENFGLVRRDGTYKPAASIFLNGYSSRELPSNTKTYQPLTPVGK